MANHLHYFSFPTSIWFGKGAAQKALEDLKSAGVKNPLLVTDSGLAELPVLKQFEERFSGFDMSVATYSGVEGNPIESQVSKGVEAFRSHRADSIVAFGGGAPIDVAKAIAVLVHHPGQLFDYEEGCPGEKPIDQEIPYFVALPTTAGTGSEVGRSTVISVDKTKEKKIIYSPRLLPKGVYADPELTIGLPPKMTAATGMDALTHLTEAFIAKGYHPICDGIALEGIRLVSQSLENGVRDGGDLEARGEMLLASMMGAIAFQKGLGATHSFAHALSTVCDLHHGLANGIMIPHVMKFNQSAVKDRFERMAQAAGVPDYVQWLFGLVSGIGIPKTLAEVGVEETHLDRLVEFAFKDPCHTLNPRSVSKEDFRTIYREALGDR